ncbi:MAG: NPCBM/NEW2 domain-containing protein [Caloramator sp.]|nr:NPCBM/NEW2 domain-containing protein [Caloramator sp.]
MKAKKFLAIFVAFIMFVSIKPAFGASNTLSKLQSQIKTLQAQLNQKIKENDSLSSQINSLKENSITALNIKYSFDGVEKPSTYNDGSANLPAAISYKGVIYVPVKYMAENVDKPYSYDVKNKTIYIGKKPEGNYFVDTVKLYSSRNLYYEYKDFSTTGMQMGGKDYYKGYKFQVYSWEKDNNSFYFNLDGKYKTISGKIGYDDKSFKNPGAKVYFIGDDNVLATIDLGAHDLPKDFSVNVENVSKLQIKISHEGSWDNFYIDMADVLVK